MVRFVYMENRLPNKNGHAKDNTKTGINWKKNIFILLSCVTVIGISIYGSSLDIPITAWTPGYKEIANTNSMPSPNSSESFTSRRLTVHGDTTTIPYAAECRKCSYEGATSDVRSNVNYSQRTLPQIRSMVGCLRYSALYVLTVLIQSNCRV